MTPRLPSLSGRIERRLLVNYRADPEVVRRILPPLFEPQLVEGHSIVGICLIRIGSARPSGLPRQLGVTAEHVAHRIAVTMPGADGTTCGVFIPRRDTDSRLVTLVGSRFFSGGLHRARSSVTEVDGRYRVAIASDDGTMHVAVDGTITDTLPRDSVFGDVDASSAFFAAGAVGYSAGGRSGCFDGVHLGTSRWEVRPLAVSEVHSSFFDDGVRFPSGSIAFDHALLMTDIESHWTALPALTSGAQVA